MYPFLKWAGGKSRLLPEIRSVLPKKYNKLIEPFVGAGSVFMGLSPEELVINDYNEELINCYRVIRDDVDALIKELEVLSKKISEKDFLDIRNIDRDKDKFKEKTNVEKAARTIYLNKTCFNGLYRVNSNNQFNVPFGKYKNPRILDENNLKEISLFLKNATILSGDFEKALDFAKSGDLVYFDPPYYPISKTSSFTAYTKNGFTEKDQIRLKENIDKLDSLDINFLLSNSCCEFIKNLYKDYTIKEIETRRMISASSVGRNIVKEVLIYNY